MKIILIQFLLLIATQFSCSTLYSCSSNDDCGCSSSSALMNRIVGGEAASANTWGWAVSLSINNAMCEGSIVSETWVLTAAHCVRGAVANQVIVYAGSNVILNSSQIRSVSSIVVHPNYDPSTSLHDIALLELFTTLNMSDPGVSIICLPSVNSATLSGGEWPSAATTVIAVGWGRLNETGPSSPILQQVSMQTVDGGSSQCTPVTTDSYYQMCAASSCKDTCQGDSGGPLMAFTLSNQWVLVGVTSTGIGCARKEYAGSYTRIAAYQAWITSTIGTGFFNPASSTLVSSTTEIDSTIVCSASYNYQLTFICGLSFIVYIVVNA